MIIRDVNDPLSIIGENKTGGINIIDLANIYSCPFIATQDLGKIVTDETFKIQGGGKGKLLIENDKGEA